MSNNLRPIGSEKLQGLEKINRIIEISRYKESIPNSINETSRTEYGITLSDGQNYAIVREKAGYIIKKTISEGTTEYIEPMKNRKYFQSYSQAFKKLNLMAKELNTLHENSEGVSLFSEQKKFVLKTPKADVSAEPASDENLDMPPADESPALDIDLPEPSGEEMDSEELDLDIPTDDMDQMDDEKEADSSEEGGNSFKSIQKLTGKLAQKIRTINNGDGLNSKDAKYVLNSIISALNLEKMDNDDKDEVISRLEGSEEDDYNLEPEVDFEADLDLDMEAPAPDEDEMQKEEMGEAEHTGMLGKKFTDGVKSKFTNLAKEKMGEMSEDMEKKHIENIFDEVFSESKVDKVISKYFSLSENEKKESENKIQRKLREISAYAESANQKVVAEKFLKNNPHAVLLGKSNKDNIIFVNEGKKIRVTPKGQIL